MKKQLLSFLLCAAALSCAVSPLRADALPDGLIITIEGTSLNTGNCSNFTSPNITGGRISYDIENRVLRLQNVTMKSNSSCLFRISGSTTPVTIDIQGDCNITSTYAKADAVMQFDVPVVFTSTRQGTLDIQADKAYGIFFAPRLTIKGGADISINSGTYGIRGGKLDTGSDDSPDLLIDGSSLSLHGGDASLDNIRTLTLTDSELPSGITWDSETSSLQNGGSDYTGDLKITRAAGVYYYRLVSFGGRVSISDPKTGKPLDNPLKVKEAIDIRITAEDTDDYTFLQWGSGQTEKEISGFVLPVFDVEYVAYFARNVKTEAPWYVCHLTSFAKYTDRFATETTLGATGFASKQIITGAGVRYGSGNMAALLYATKPENGKAGFRYDVLNLDNVGSIQQESEVIAPQTDYFPVYAIAYNTFDRTFYCCAKNVSKDKNYLLKIDPDGKKISEVCALADIKNEITAMTAGTCGELYIIEADDVDATLWTVHFLTETAIPVPVRNGRVGVASSNAKKRNALGFDHVTGELIWMQSDAATSANSSVRVINSDDCTTDYVSLAAGANNACAMFQMNNTCHIALKAADPSTGSVFFQNNLRAEGYFVPGAEVPVFASPAAYRRFVRWTDGNTDNPRIVKADGKVPEYTAEFDWEEGVTAYDIWVGKMQILSERTTVSYSNETMVANDGGFVAFDPATNTLTLDNVTISGDTESLLTIGRKGGEAGQPLTVKLNGDVNLLSTNKGGCCIAVYNTDVTFVSDGKGMLALYAQNQSSGIRLDASDLTFHGVKAAMDAQGCGIAGTGIETLAVRGSDMSVKGLTGSITDLAQLECNWCNITAPADAAFNPATHCVEAYGTSVKAKVVFKKWPELRVAAVQEGTGTFTLRSENTGEEFTGVGWFKAGDNITVTAHAADGYVFSRWTSDPDWGNESKKDNWWGEEISGIKSSVDETISALFYYEPQSSATWYAINGNKFVSFNMGDHAEHPETASAPSASGIQAGDYRGGYWELREPLGITTLPFNGLNDGEELSGKDGAERVITNSALKLVDMAYDISNDIMYATDGTALYTFDYDNGTINKVGNFMLKTKLVAVAVALDGTIYGVCPDAKDAVLCKVEDIDADAGIVWVFNASLSGNSTMGIPVTDDGNYSLAFDHATGELFFAGSDYIYSIDTETGKARICGDLGMKKGAQGAVTAMHRMPRLVSVKVKVAEECEDMGTVSVSRSKAVSGTKVTVTAKPNSGYEFSYWAKENSGTKVSTDSEYTFTVKSKVTYVAYFEKAAGLGEVKTDAAGGTQKLLIDGVLYIVRDGRIYTPDGQLVR